MLSGVSHVDPQIPDRSEPAFASHHPFPVFSQGDISPGAYIKLFRRAGQAEISHLDRRELQTVGFQPAYRHRIHRRRQSHADHRRYRDRHERGGTHGEPGDHRPLGHEELRAVDHPAVALGLGLHGDEGGVELGRRRLGEGQRHAQSTLGDLGKELLLLGLAAGREDRAAAQDDGGEVADKIGTWLTYILSSEHYRAYDENGDVIGNRIFYTNRQPQFISVGKEVNNSLYYGRVSFAIYEDYK